MSLTHPGTKGTAITVDARNPQTARATIVPVDFISSHAWNKSKEIRIKDTVCARHAWGGIYYYYRCEWCLGRFAIHKLQEPDPAMLLPDWRNHNITRILIASMNYFVQSYRRIIMITSIWFFAHHWTISFWRIRPITDSSNYCYFGFLGIMSIKSKYISVFSVVMITEVTF